MMYTRVQLSMQQDYVIDEIERYGVPLYPEDQATLVYLKAMRLLFERGFSVMQGAHHQSRLCCHRSN